MTVITHELPRELYNAIEVRHSREYADKIQHVFVFWCLAMEALARNVEVCKGGLHIKKSAITEASYFKNGPKGRYEEVLAYAKEKLHAEPDKYPFRGLDGEINGRPTDIIKFQFADLLPESDMSIENVRHHMTRTLWGDVVSKEAYGISTTDITQLHKKLVATAWIAKKDCSFTPRGISFRIKQGAPFPTACIQERFLTLDGYGGLETFKAEYLTPAEGRTYVKCPNCGIEHYA